MRSLIQIAKRRTYLIDDSVSRLYIAMRRARARLDESQGASSLIVVRKSSGNRGISNNSKSRGSIARLCHGFLTKMIALVERVGRLWGSWSGASERLLT